MTTTILVRALDTIKSVDTSLAAVIFNQHQCRRLADLYTRVGRLLKHLSESANSSADDSEHPLFSSLLVTASVLQKGRILITSYTSKDWVGRLLTADVNQGSFEAIYVELEGCIQSIYGACPINLQGTVPKESVMPLLHLSAGDRETLFHADADKDRMQMGVTIRDRRSALTQRKSLDPEEIDEVRSLDMVFEKISQSKSDSPELIKKLPKYLSIESEEIIVEELLGHGGYADVHRCQWLHQNFAVKIFRRQNDEAMIKEMLNLIPLRHPNIVQLIGFSVDWKGGRAMLVMELLDCDLRDIIDDRGSKIPYKPPFTLSESIDLIYQIAAGMAYLHKKKIFHGDLKSRNVLVAKHPGDLQSYALKISDFGVSQLVKTVFANDTLFSTANTLTGGNIGTTRWMAPEIFQKPGESWKPNSKPAGLYSPMADVYSFGITCSEILTGKIPYENFRGHKSISDYVLSGGRPELPAELPKCLNDLIVRCWDPDPQMRPSFNNICGTIQQLFAALPAKPAQRAHFSCGFIRIVSCCR